MKRNFMMRNIFFIAVALSFLLTFYGIAFCSQDNSAGVIVEVDKGLQLFYMKKGKKVEIKPVETKFVDPYYFTKSDDGRYLVFVDSAEGSDYDGSLYIHDTVEYLTKKHILRNVNIKTIKRIKWFDCHSFAIKFGFSKYPSFLVGDHGPLESGSYILKFQNDLGIETLLKITW